MEKREIEGEKENWDRGREGGREGGRVYLKQSM
jgi:hypothetical protein